MGRIIMSTRNEFAVKTFEHHHNNENAIVCDPVFMSTICQLPHKGMIID